MSHSSQRVRKQLNTFVALPLSKGCTRQRLTLARNGDRSIQSLRQTQHIAAAKIEHLGQFNLNAAKYDLESSPGTANSRIQRR